MVGNGGTIKAMRLVCSKLRKNEESALVSSDQCQLNTSGEHKQDQQIDPNSSLRDNGPPNSFGLTTRTNGDMNWVFPPRAPLPNVCNCFNNDASANLSDRNGFKGFRKQFSGRFKRLVTAKKPEPPSVIPPELKPQLKTIYVY